VVAAFSVAAARKPKGEIKRREVPAIRIADCELLLEDRLLSQSWHLKLGEPDVVRQ